MLLVHCSPTEFNLLLCEGSPSNNSVEQFGILALPLSCRIDEMSGVFIEFALMYYLIAQVTLNNNEPSKPLYLNPVLSSISGTEL